ncbi:hypothetical protein JOL62DRAFT_234561 [Phyllosticta paracitricarpa]|uniref:Uncharacterized protein n=1 Tax=Phyllosticta paracitricarpa TaxID=2016321 RepID=A0ABR1NHW5_9PEZI
MGRACAWWRRLRWCCACPRCRQSGCWEHGARQSRGTRHVSWRNSRRRTCGRTGLKFGGSRGPAEAAVEATVGISCCRVVVYWWDMIVAVIKRRVVVLGRMARRGLGVDGGRSLGVGTVVEGFERRGAQALDIVEDVLGLQFVGGLMVGRLILLVAGAKVLFPHGGFPEGDHVSGVVCYWCREVGRRRRMGCTDCRLGSSKSNARRSRFQRRGRQLSRKQTEAVFVYGQGFGQRRAFIPGGGERSGTSDDAVARATGSLSRRR